MTFQDIFESCVKLNNMIPIGVYIKHDQIKLTARKSRMLREPETRSKHSRENPKYVWMHPPKKILLNVYDELFVLSEKNDKDNMKDPSKPKEDDSEANGASKVTQNQGKKAQ